MWAAHNAPPTYNKRTIFIVGGEAVCETVI